MTDIDLQKPVHYTLVVTLIGFSLALLAGILLGNPTTEAVVRATTISVGIAIGTFLVSRRNAES
jgi:uncharacterized membrane protein YccC